MPPFLGVVLQSRAVHFLVLGGALFALAPRREDPAVVAVSGRDLAAIHAAQAARQGVPSLAAAEARAVDQRALEDEVLYREALRYGLDRGDNVVRAHLIQKMLLLAEDMAGATRTPTNEDLLAHYAATRDKWARGVSVHFVHAFAARHESAGALAAAVRSEPDRARDLGDPFPSSRDVSGERAAIAMVYGDAFADSVVALPVGTWSDPIESKFGWHVVKVLAHEGGHPASFEEVHDALALDWAVERRHKAIASFMTRGFDRYQITLDGAPVPRTPPGERLARRLDPSAED